MKFFRTFRSAFVIIGINVLRAFESYDVKKCNAVKWRRYRLSIINSFFIRLVFDLRDTSFHCIYFFFFFSRIFLIPPHLYPNFILGTRR